MNDLSLFLPCAAGVEDFLAQEVHALTGRMGQDLLTLRGGVRVRADWRDALKLNLHSRLAQRVLIELAHAPYRSENDLYAIASGVAWEIWFTPKQTFKIETTAQHSPLQSLNFATLRIKDAIADRFRAKAGGVRPSIETQWPDCRVFAHLTTDTFTLYIDTSGEPLFKRGWRRDAEDAPIRENLAAGLIVLSGWQPGTAFLDPMCGSGTIAIEAASIAADRAPGLARTFGFQKLAWFDGPTWQRLKQRARDRIKTAPASPPVFASDRLSAAVATTRANAALAQLDAFLRVEQADVLVRAAPAPTGVIVANPPYGIRLDDKARVAAMYPKLGDALKARFTGWSAWLFSGDTELPKKIGLKAERRIPLWNGAIECRLYAYRIVSGKHEA